MALNMSTVWLDNSGRGTINLIRTNTGGSGIQGAIDAVSNAGVFNTWEGTLVITTPSSTTATYASVTSEALLQFQCADGTEAQLAIPAPSLSIFLSDGVTVDQTMITALIAACIGTLVSTSLSPATAYLSGYLRSRD